MQSCQEISSIICLVSLFKFRALGRQTQMAHIHQQSYQYTPTTKKKCKMHPEKLHKDTIYIPYFSFCVANAAILLWVTCVANKNVLTKWNFGRRKSPLPAMRLLFGGVLILGFLDPMGLLSLEQSHVSLTFPPRPTLNFWYLLKECPGKTWYSHGIYIDPLEWNHCLKFGEFHKTSRGLLNRVISSTQ